MEDRGALEEKEQLENKIDINEAFQIKASLEISEKVWSNDIIWNEITSYLRISDLKELSCVNQYFLHKVRSINRFTSLAGQVVTGKLEIHVFKLCRAIVLVKKINGKALKEKASEIFQDTEYLEIHCLAKLSDNSRRLIQIIANCPKLKSLAFGKYSFVGKGFKSFLNNSSVKLILSKLKELHLEVYNDKYITKEDKSHKWYTITESERRKNNTLQSFNLLSDLEMSLAKFSYQSPQNDLRVKCFFSPEIVLSSSQNTLVELNLDVPFGTTLGLQNMKFPKLEKFRLTLNNTKSYSCTQEILDVDSYDMNLKIFLKNHLLSLTHFELDYPDFDFLFRSFYVIFEVLKLSKKIKVLCLGRADGRKLEDRTTVMAGEEWDNLADISNLCSLDVWTGRDQRKFFVSELQDNLTQFRRYAKILPPNAHSFTFGRDFSAESDFGLSGKREHDNYDSGISIANLKGLRRLYMYPKSAREFNITWDGFLQSIHFLELVDLRVMTHFQDSNSFINTQANEVNQRNYLRLICKSQNPSLEKVFLKFYKPDENERENIRRVNPRTKFYSFDGGFFEN